MSRRPVRATAAFFDDLDAQLARERGPLGQPSTNDFQTLDLLEIVERVASDFDSLPPLIEGRQDYRVLIGTGRIVRGYAVVAQLAPDGAIELISLDIDTSWQ